MANRCVPDLIVLPDLEAVSREAARRFVELAQSAVAQTDRVYSVALSGGSTPQRLYELLASPPYSRRIAWDSVHVFWGDERAVPPDDPGSNYRLAREQLLDHVPIPAANVHRIKGELGPPEAAQAYAKELNRFFGTSIPVFDLVLLGMGDDGHTASLFPGSEGVRETSRPVVAVTAQYQDRPADRITLTSPAINSARTVMFLISGSAKAETLQTVLQGPYQPDVLPAQIVQPASGQLIFLVASDAATKVQRA
jgi:6-phosphogluconolactonase